METTNLMDAIQTEDTRTENLMVTNSTSLNKNVDFFFTAGAMRNEDEKRIIEKFSKAFNEDKLTATKLLFWARDVRGGAGERRLSRIIYKYLVKNHEDILLKNLGLLPEYGRWDDILSILELSTGKLKEEILSLIKKELDNKNGLLSKWLPRPTGKHKKIANIIRSYLKLTPKDYRKLLVKLTNVVETPMCAKEYEKIDYEKVPSLAMARYQKAFLKNDEKGFNKYKEKLQKGEAKINVGAVYPYDVIKSLQHGDIKVSEEQWKNLSNYLEGNKERILTVIDVSGSMESGVGGNLRCIDVSVSLGLYLSERLEGIFKDYFVTFSETPKLQHLKGSLNDRFLQLNSAEWGMNTNLEAVFKLILSKAVKHDISPDQMPSVILIISDMEFDNCIEWDVGAQEMIEKMYDETGYKVPVIVFWNVQSRHDNIPVKFDKKGVVLISGFSPSIMKYLLGGNISELSPEKMMMGVVNSKRYEKIIV